MYDLRRFFPAQYLACRALVCGLGLAAFSLTARADAVTDAAYARFRSELSANELLIRYGGLKGNPLKTSSGILINGGPGAGATVSQKAGLLTKYGRLGFTASQRFSTAAMIRGVGAVAGGPLAVGILAAPFVYDWLTDSGLVWDPDQKKFGTLNDRDYFRSTGVYLKVANGLRVSYGHSEAEACTAWGATGEGTGPYTGVSWSGGICYGTAPGGASRLGSLEPASVDPPYPCPAGYLSNGTHCVPEAPFEPASVDEITDMLTEHARASEDLAKILEELAKLKPDLEPDPADTPQAAPDAAPGNQTDQKTSTDTKTNPDGSTEETTKTCRAGLSSASSSTLKVTETCTTTVIKTGTDGTTETTTGETTSEDAEATKPETEEGGICDTLIGKLICSDLDTPEAEPIDKTTKTLSYSPEDHFGGGACPADLSMTTHNGKNLKVWDWAASCDKINQFFRPLFLTLCAFTALMILAPAVKEA